MCKCKFVVVPTIVGIVLLGTVSYLSADEQWIPTSTTNAPTERIWHTAVWADSEMIVWGGSNVSNYYKTGGRYNPTTDSWTATDTTNAPEGRCRNTAVWTGSEMIVWGGGIAASPYYAKTGGRYNPTTDSWTATDTTTAPEGTYLHTAVWTGSEMIVWGGIPFTNTGGRYKPSSNTWTATSTTNAPTGRTFHTAVWTGSEMIVWGGRTSNNPATYTNTGGRYNPVTNSWTATDTTGAPTARDGHTAVWTGTEMIVWGGYDATGDVSTGGRYNPSTNTWTATTTTGAPTARDIHTAVWTGSEMIVWAGSGPVNTGSRYNPTDNSWTATTMTNVPDARYYHTAVWADSEMIVWGGWSGCGNPSCCFNTGGRYKPGSLGIEENANFKSQNAKLDIYPNPFSTRTSIQYVVGSSQGKDKTLPTICIYDLSGRLVKTLIPDPLSPIPAVSWDGTDESGYKLTAGIYFLSLETDNFTQTKKVIKLQ